jgi:hypothetical protein
MGKQAQVQAVFAEGAETGRLLYEPPKLIFRGASRRVFEGAALTAVRADGGDLVLGDGSRFRLGEKVAAGWVGAILNPKGRLEKLGVKSGLSLGISNLDDADFLRELTAAGIEPAKALNDLDVLVYGADRAGELDRIGDLVLRLTAHGALWIVSLKGKLARVKDAEVMAAAKAHGLVDIKVCAFSETRTALKFVRRNS